MASTLYPSVLQEELELEQVPECQLCHTTSRGGPNTARKPFARTLIDLGLTGAANITTLRTLVNELGDADSDSDGVSDISELQHGSDPNDAESVPEETSPAPSEVDAGAELPAVDAGDVAKTDAWVDAPHRQDAGRDADAAGSSTAVTSTRNETGTPELPPDKPGAEGPSSDGCTVSAGASSAASAWLVGLAALVVLCRRRLTERGRSKE